MQENPGAYHEARNRIREKQEQEARVIEKKRDEYEIGKERVYTKKKLDVFELKRKIETGQSLSLLKDDVRQALADGNISIETYNTVLSAIEGTSDDDHESYQIRPENIPFSQTQIAQYLESQKLGDNIGVDIGGFVFGFTQGSVFLVFLLGRIVLDFLLLPKDIYSYLQK